MLSLRRKKPIKLHRILSLQIYCRFLSSLLRWAILWIFRKESRDVLKQSHYGSDNLELRQHGFDMLRSCCKITQVNARQDKNRQKSAVHMRVNEHFEPIFNAVLCQLRGFATASQSQANASCLDVTSTTERLSVV